MTLYAATRHLHHACEAHPFGARMAKGEIARAEWAMWLRGFRILHIAADIYAPASMAREEVLEADLADLPDAPTPVACAALASMLRVEKIGLGAAYVLHGAHRRGGVVMRPVLTRAGLPCRHVSYPDPAEAEAFVKATRDRGDCAPGAVACFEVLLSAMTEIEGRHV